MGTHDVRLLLAHRDFVRALARGLVSDEDRADDLAQQTWLAAIERPMRSDASARAWLASVARNLARRLFRSEERRARLEAHAPARDRGVPSTSEIVERESVRREVVEAVLDLDEPYRSTVLLRFYEDLPPREIAKRLGVPVETVRTRLKRGLAQLRERLDAEHGGDRRAWCVMLAPLGATPTTPAAPMSLWLGAIAMKTSMKVTAAVVLLVLVLLALWLARGLVWPDASPDVATRDAATRDVAAERPPSSPLDANRPSESPGAPLPTRVARVSGIVVGPDDAVVVGARVVSVSSGAKETIRPDSPTGSASPTWTKATDGEGRFEIDLDPRAPYGSLFVEKDGFSPAALEPVRAGEHVRIRLDRPRVLTGTIVDAIGRPVSGATARFIGVVSSCRVDRQAISKDDGSYRIDGLPSQEALSRAPFGDRWWLDVRASGFAPLFIEHAPDESEDPGDLRLDLVLVSGATVNGRAVDDETGEPLPGTPVFLWSVEGAPEQSRDSGVHLKRPDYPRLLDETRTASDGTFTFRHVTSQGFHRVSAYQGAFAFVGVVSDAHAPACKGIDVPSDGANVDVEVRCWPRSTVAGRVVDSASRPIAGATMGAWLAGTKWEWRPPGLFDRVAPAASATTDADGRYRLEAVPATRRSDSRVKILATLRRAGSMTQGDVEIPVRAGGVVEAPDIVIADSRAADFVVTDRDGRPIWGAIVVAEVYAGVEQRTDERGRLRVTFAAHSGPAHSRSLVVRAPGFAAASSPEFVPSVESPPEVRVVLEPGHRLAGKVVHADGSPARNAIVDVLLADPRVEAKLEEDYYDTLGKQFPYPDIRTGTTRTKADGSFEVDGLPEGACIVSAQWNPPLRINWPPPPLRTARVGVSPDARDLVLTLPEELPPSDVRTGFLTGTVLDAETRRPVLRFRVALDAYSNAHWAERTGPGKFRLGPVPEGTYPLYVLADGYVPLEVPEAVVDPEQEAASIDVAVRRGITVRGVVRVPEGVDPSLLVFLLGGVNRERFRTFPIARDGSFVATGVGPGRYTPLVRTSHHGPPHLAPVHPVDVVVPEGTEDLRVEFEFALAGTMNVYLARRRPEPGHSEGPNLPPEELASPVNVEARDADGCLAARWTFTHTIYYQEATVAPGEYSLTVRLPDGTEVRSTVQVEPSRLAEVALELP